MAYTLSFSIDHLIKWKQNIVSLNWVNIIVCSVFERVLYLRTIERNGIRYNVKKKQIQIDFAREIQFTMNNSEKRRTQGLY